MNLYKVHVKETEFMYDRYSNFIVIAGSEQEVIKVIYSFTQRDGEIPSYIQNNLIIKKIGSMNQVEDGYSENVILYSYIQA